MKPKKSLGQNWLNDKDSLDYIIGLALCSSKDFVLEIGPGQGALTRQLVKRVGQVLAVELDSSLITSLRKINASNLQVVQGDFLQFRLEDLPRFYKVVANVPYYITSKIIKKLLTTSNKPARIVLLLQKEVAERLAAGPGDYSILGISAQFYAVIELGRVITAENFEPRPKVDSRVVIMTPHNKYQDVDDKLFFRVVKAGFSARRKKLRSSLAGGLNLTKTKTDELLNKAKIDPNLRSQDLAIDDWLKIASMLAQIKN